MRTYYRLASILCVASLVLPSITHAATARPVTKALTFSDVLAISQKNKKSTAFEFAAKGTSGETSVTFDVKGTQKGNATSLAGLASDLTFSMKALMEDDSHASAKGRIIFVDGTMYATLESFDTDNEFLAIYRQMLEGHFGTWYSLPLDESDFEKNTAKNAKNGALLRSIDSYFTVKKETTREGATYVVTVPKAKQRLHMKQFMAKSSTLPSYATTRLGSFGSGGLDMKFTMKTVKDLFDSLALRVSVSSKADGAESKTTIVGSVKVMDSIPTIAAPADSTPWAEFSKKSYEESMEKFRIDPKFAADRRNMIRSSDVKSTLDALQNNTFYWDQISELPINKTVEICSPNSSNCNGFLPNDPIYGSLFDLFRDPSLPRDSFITGYTISKDVDNKITISAPLAENGVEISVTR